MDEQRQSENIYRFKWFMSLARKHSHKTEEPLKQNNASSAKMSHSSGVFFTLRKRFQTLTSVNVEAFKPDQFVSSDERQQLAESPNIRSENDFARIVLESHSQNPIRFSSPNENLPVIPIRGVQPPPLQVPPEPRNACSTETRNDSDNLETMMDKVRKDLLKYGWYWGKLTRSAAQKRLARQDNGTFLVRDSETGKHQFAISFRSSGITLHCRIDFKDNNWSFPGLASSTQYATMIELIEDSIKKSEFDVIGFGKQTSPLTPPFPVRLNKPINRFCEIPTLQHMCKFIIRQRVDVRNITYLPLPSKLKTYIEENV